ncbi:MAG TPA: hypothetical protein IAA13_04240 [Candidatus Alistipes merdigallinarum]|nr:hypothetical protein [Candidatus Alistipes merdigallinarum]
MNIVKFPTQYSSAFKEAICQISATTNEIVELDLYDHAGTSIIGRRRFYGASSYDVNLAYCGQCQLDVLPLNTVQCVFVVPTGRAINVTVGAGSLRRSTVLTGGQRTCFSYEKLSESPDMLDISTNEWDEIAVIAEGGSIRADVIVENPTAMVVELATKSDAQGLLVFALKMSDLVTKLTAAGKNTLAPGEQIKVRISDGEDYVLAEQGYRIVSPSTDSVRLCWWNALGQIDYYTMRRMLESEYELQKERILAPDGYKVTECKRERKMKIVSDFVDSETIEWLSEIASSPRVWLVENGQPVRVDVLAESVKLSGTQPVQVDVTLRYNDPDFLQHE